MTLTAIRTEKLDLGELVAAVEHDGAGAITTFIGNVRNRNDGMDVSLLEYQAYESMAEKELAAIAAEVEAEADGIQVACIHRIGELQVGDAAIICAASAPHRGEAFHACRQLIDRIKARVPIFKREHGPNGPHWIGWRDVRSDGDQGNR